MTPPFPSHSLVFGTTDPSPVRIRLTASALHKPRLASPQAATTTMQTRTLIPFLFSLLTVAAASPTMAAPTEARDINLAVDASISVDIGVEAAKKLGEVPGDVATIITKKKAQYARFADTHQWEKFNQVALPECTYYYTDHGKLIVENGFTYKWDTTAQFTGFFSEAFKTVQTLHHVGIGEFRWMNAQKTKVEAIFGVYYASALAKGATETIATIGSGGGHYVEEYVKKGNDWLMSKCTMDRIYEAPK